MGDLSHHYAPTGPSDAADLGQLHPTAKPSLLIQDAGKVLHPLPPKVQDLRLREVDFRPPRSAAGAGCRDQLVVQFCQGDQRGHLKGEMRPPVDPAQQPGRASLASRLEAPCSRG
jgi:hypothetical protein